MTIVPSRQIKALNCTEQTNSLSFDHHQHLIILFAIAINGGHDCARAHGKGCYGRKVWGAGLARAGLVIAGGDAQMGCVATGYSICKAPSLIASRIGVLEGQDILARK